MQSSIYIVHVQQLRPETSILIKGVSLNIEVCPQTSSTCCSIWLRVWCATMSAGLMSIWRWAWSLCATKSDIDISDNSCAHRRKAKMTIQPNTGLYNVPHTHVYVTLKLYFHKPCVLWSNSKGIRKPYACSGNKQSRNLHVSRGYGRSTWMYIMIWLLTLVHVHVDAHRNNRNMN